MTLGQVAGALGGTLVGPADLTITGLGEPHRPEPGELVVCFAGPALAAAEAAGATAAVVPTELTSRLPHILVDQPRVALVMLLHAFDPKPAAPAGVHPTATVDPSATLGAQVTVGPHAVVGAGAVLGDRVVLGPGCVVGDGCAVGDGTRLEARAVLYPRCQIGARVIIHSGAVIGADGFGYRPDSGRHVKIPQIGRVIIGDDVEIGACTTIDRATLGATRVGRGTKIDNLVMIGHNCQIGEDCVIIGQVGMAGSVTVGDRAIIAGQAGIADHRTIGAGARVGPQSGLMHDVPAGQTWFGTPAAPEKQFFRGHAGVRRLSELFRRLRDLERRVGPGGDE